MMTDLKAEEPTGTQSESNDETASSEGEKIVVKEDSSIKDEQREQAAPALESTASELPAEKPEEPASPVENEQATAPATAAVPAEPATAAPVKVASAPTPDSQHFQVSSLWWVAASFVLPFAVLATYLSVQNAYSFKLCVRSGLIGVGAAVLIALLWKLDGKISKSHPTDVSAQLVLRMLAMMLWLVWVGASHVILLATDEVYPPIDLTYLHAPHTVAKH